MSLDLKRNQEESGNEKALASDPLNCRPEASLPGHLDPSVPVSTLNPCLSMGHVVCQEHSGLGVS